MTPGINVKQANSSPERPDLRDLDLIPLQHVRKLCSTKARFPAGQYQNRQQSHTSFASGGALLLYQQRHINLTTAQPCSALLHTLCPNILRKSLMATKD